jgi:CMP-N-acetylneuraminic acid synthetase
MKVLAVIPARIGSKGIPLKNIRKLQRKSLLEYSILEAKKSKSINRIIVSTDSQRIANIAKSLNVETVIRPKKISSAKASNLDVIIHLLACLKKTESYVPDIIVLLQPTTPLRTKDEINYSIRLLKKSHATSVVSVIRIRMHPYSSFWYNGKYLKPFRKDFLRWGSRQSKPVLFHPSGAIYTFWYNNIKKYGSMYGSRVKPMITPDEQPHVDIDNVFDFFMNEMILRYWKKYKINFDSNIKN